MGWEECSRKNFTRRFEATFITATLTLALAYRSPLEESLLQKFIWRTQQPPPPDMVSLFQNKPEGFLQNLRRRQLNRPARLARVRDTAHTRPENRVSAPILLVSLFNLRIEPDRSQKVEPMIAEDLSRCAFRTSIRL